MVFFSILKYSANSNLEISKCPNLSKILHQIKPHKVTIKVVYKYFTLFQFQLIILYSQFVLIFQHSFYKVVLFCLLMILCLLLTKHLHSSYILNAAFWTLSKSSAFSFVRELCQTTLDCSRILLIHIEHKCFSYLQLMMKTQQLFWVTAFLSLLLVRAECVRTNNVHGCEGGRSGH